MAELSCKVTNCTYNKDKLCCKGDILVGGTHAKESGSTCCESFVQKKSDSYTSATAHPSNTISIDCEAVNCVYNADYKCKAKKVDILGNGALNSAGTSCGTFKEAK
ncbi:MAG: DUF1540 domain-containing protein [Lachnospiraceae bacterium]|nr:DUF1540 domain-containing protein [Lachnospiraceae bacterium]